MPNRFTNVPLALLLSAALPALANAQQGSVELGLDALSLRVDVASAFGQTATLTTLSVPVKTFRAGYFVSNRISFEPRISFDIIQVEDEDAVTLGTLSLGALYHFTPERQGTQVYLRPVSSFSFISVRDQSVSQVFLGVGLGIRLPIGEQLGSRIELEYGHGFKNDDFANVNSLAVVFGFSFFISKAITGL